MKKSLLLALAALTCSHSALAKEDVIFSCISKSGKQLVVTEDSHNYYYSYGKNGRPEMRFATDKDMEVSSDVLILYHKGIEYMIYDFSKYDVGVKVSKNDKVLADTKCQKVLVGFNSY
ncbi:hypothetical protein A4G19_09030 [Pasteurellaceae bacterium Macca]|nr:hypothetical protein [Pasteurellaceae bacterium Macca]